MKIPFTLTVTHSVDCKSCGHEVSAGTRKGSYVKLLIHLKVTCPDRATRKDLSLIKGLWELFWWNP